MLFIYWLTLTLTPSQWRASEANIIETKIVKSDYEHRDSPLGSHIILPIYVPIIYHSHIFTIMYKRRNNSHFFP
jgi:hypothetical protein